MHVMHPVCCGSDGHQAPLTAGLCSVEGDGQVTQEVRACATTSSALCALTAWLVEPHDPGVAMESPGVYWQPVYHVRSGTLEVVVGNAQERRRRPGHQTDEAEARWIAERLAHGLIRPSVLPPPPIQALREASVVADLFGVSGRWMLAAFMAGDRDPQGLATFARERLRRKLAARELAWKGQFTAHQARLMTLA
jgi:transposase